MSKHPALTIGCEAEIPTDLPFILAKPMMILVAQSLWTSITRRRQPSRSRHCACHALVLLCRYNFREFGIKPPRDHHSSK